MARASDASLLAIQSGNKVHEEDARKHRIQSRAIGAALRNQCIKTLGAQKKNPPRSTYFNFLRMGV